MSCNVCYMSGYGISMRDLYSLLTEEAQDMDCFSIVDEMKDDFKSWTLDSSIRQQLKQPQMLGLDTVCNYE